MKEYQEVKQELSKTCTNLKYFTRAFYADFVKAYQAATAATIAGTSPRYEKGGIVLNHCYDAIYNSRFYQDNSGTYCEFLSVFYGSMPTFKARFYKGVDLIRTTSIYAETIEAAKGLAEAYKSDYSATYAEVCKA